MLSSFIAKSFSFLFYFHEFASIRVSQVAADRNLAVVSCYEDKCEQCKKKKRKIIYAVCYKESQRSG